MRLVKMEEAIDPGNGRYYFINFETTDDKEYYHLDMGSFWLVWDTEKENYNYAYLYDPYDESHYDPKGFILTDEFHDEYFVLPHPNNDVDIRVTEVLENNGGITAMKKMIIDYMI